MNISPFNSSILTISLFVCSTSIFADINNEGFIGAPFYGTISDTTGGIVNQVGPNAEFALPSTLNARSELTTLLSGEFSKLSASLSLDDGTITNISPLAISWDSTSPELLIKDGFVTAQAISKNTRASISATAEGLSATVFISLKIDSIESTPNALSDSVSLPQEDWKESGWFGNYFDAGNDWIYHLNLGWFYTSTDQPTSLWLWSSTQEWLWTGTGVYPHMYRDKDGTWIYLIVEAFPKKVFYNQSTKKLERSE